MTLPDRVRAIALTLPETEERDGVFLVAGEPFARVDGDNLSVRTGEAAPAEWETIPLGTDPDWTLVEDRIARSWELTAPAGLLEAGGR